MNASWGLLFGAIALSIGGQTLLKSGSRAPDFIAQMLAWTSISGLMVYGLSAVLYMVALRRLPISVAMPATALSYIAAVLIGHFVFGETVGLMQIGALVLISSGVAMLAFAS